MTEQNRELIVYTRSSFCPYQRFADKVFKKYDLKPHVILIDRDREALERVVAWTGFQSVPTILLANEGEILPYEEPSPLHGGSPRGVDRGPMITEPRANELEAWLSKHGVI